MTIAVLGNPLPARWSRWNHGSPRQAEGRRYATSSAPTFLRRYTGPSPTSLSSGSVLEVSYERLGWVWRVVGEPLYNSLHSVTIRSGTGER
jgi:hypothetical protein